jgi:protein-S-isoprenylcysteine O-methyltransferase Ste14
MIAWMNITVLVVSTLLTFFFYVKSVGPAALERMIGPIAYRRCTVYRILSSVFMTIAMVNYVIYVFHPLPLALAKTFLWPWWVSALIAILIALPSGYLWLRGMKDAGEETMIVKKGHVMYGGIYEKIRHPQAVGELPFWWVIAFLLHSPFLVLYSFIWVPVFIIMSLAEEKDLLIRYGEEYADYQRRTGAFFPRKNQPG